MARGRWQDFARVCIAIGIGALLGPLARPAAALAEAWPQHAIRIVVPFPTAGGADLAARVVGQKLSEALHQPVVIDNRPGANGNIGAQLAARAPADGYTLVVGSSANITTNPLLYTLDWDPMQDLAPVAMLSVNPMFLVVNPALVPVHTVSELITLARSRKGELDYASGGDGSPSHMATELLMMQGAFRMVAIQYKGGTPAVNDLVGGNIGVTFAAAPTVMPYARSGRLRLVASSAARRSVAAPEVPTIAESGFPRFDVFIWNMLFAPAHTPPEIVRQLNGQINRLVEQPEVRALLERQGAESLPLDTDALRKLIQEDYARWAEVVQTAHIQHN